MYLIWLACFVLVPLIAVAVAARGALRQRWPALAWTLLGALVFGGLWDTLAVRAHIWFFAPSNLFGPWLGGLPLEEWLWIAGTTLLFGTLTVLVKERFDRA